MKIIVKSVVLLFFSSIVLGCGRRGALELPPSVHPKSLQGEVVTNEADSSFVLDRLI